MVILHLAPKPIFAGSSEHCLSKSEHVSHDAGTGDGAWQSSTRQLHTSSNQFMRFALTPQTSNQVLEAWMSNFMALLVEDDHFQREVLADILRDQGLEVIECATAEAAELVVATSGTELRVVVTDDQLSGTMRGVELAEFARRKFPHLNIIVMSGHAVEHLPTNTQFLRKPFQAGQLLRAIG
jgi:CheY-like chemotaxis protein